jgi:hypothetical protein
MQKKDLDKCPQCRHSLRMSNTNQLTDKQAIAFAIDRLEKTKGSFAKDAAKKFSRDRDYILGATLQYRAAKNGGAKGLLAYWERIKA